MPEKTQENVCDQPERLSSILNMNVGVGKNNYTFSPCSLCLIRQEENKCEDKTLIAKGHMRAVIVAELACGFVIIRSLVSI